MFETARQLHFSRSLERFSARLDELLDSARLHHQQLPAEVIDEIAFTTGELMLVLTNHPSHHEDELVKEALAHARDLRERLRADQPRGELLTEECDSFRQEIARLVIDSKKAA
jgi:hypothetical protein